MIDAAVAIEAIDSVAPSNPDIILYLRGQIMKAVCGLVIGMRYSRQMIIAPV